jgi:non-ribosomal peptide synthetase component E (peptide arylation enzyme)
VKIFRAKTRHENAVGVLGTEVSALFRLKAFFQDFVNRGVVSKWGVPDKVVIVESIPKTSVGKLDKKEIRKTVKV